ncbi:PEP-CTERM sorting domain-containing protein [Microcystis aeruginosa CS-1036]|uniref:PEP-CTERM sorting domain-containing protein n=1 Tax=Microcystis TaxID=1125 RepID=UPI00232A8ED7|nr:MULTISPECIES: PEP-CTERM sorting domain-containing protein [Microcystis]MDB9404661.1 PEP-CTERM sorting domain-containing protein [Microcystis sp. CS-574]MDB9545676.1 PEP-CTERM sorting domain-containing protein [Microcystis aeruginosa CS-1036]
MTQKILAKLMSFAGSNKLGLFKIAIASSFLVIVPQGQVKAALLTVANNSFETPVITAPSGIISSTGSVGGWTFSGAQPQGFANPVAAHNAGGSWYGSSPGIIPDGNQIAWSNGGTISQTLSGTLQTNTVYTLRAFVGNRLGVNFPGYNIGLYAGGNLLASNSGVTPADGTFAPVTVSYTSGISVTPGQALEIRLTSLSGSNAQTNFDNITLDAASIPEPSAILGLLGFGLLGIASKLRQKQ